MQPIDLADFRDTYYDGYNVAADGRVLSTKYGRRTLLPYCARPKRPKVQFSLGTVTYRYYVDELVLEAWDRPKKAGETVGYRDGDVRNCCLSNIYWVGSLSPRERRVAEMQKEIGDRTRKINELNELNRIGYNCITRFEKMSDADYELLMKGVL